jgi:hypothetical protein
MLEWCYANSVKAHIIGSTILSFTMWFFYPFVSIFMAVLLSLLLSSLIFFAKELVDKYGKRKTGFSWVDLFVNYLSWGISTWAQLWAFGIGFELWGR